MTMDVLVSPSTTTTGHVTRTSSGIERERTDARCGHVVDGCKLPSHPPETAARNDRRPEDVDADLQRLLSRPIYRQLRSLYEAPEFVQRLSSYTESDVGGSAVFSAQYQALPSPCTVHWFKDNEELHPSERCELDASSSETEGITVRLIIHDVSTDDEGAYKCKVENKEGAASTTGYLSVAGKPSHRTRSTRASSKLSPTRACTSPCLGPIAEQKSMEEREEIELSRQPPSPLQEFINNIRHSAKSKHAPICYADGADLFMSPDDDGSEDEAFRAESSTPTNAPDILLLSHSDANNNKQPTTDSVHVSNSSAVSLDTSSTTQSVCQCVRQLSNQDSAYDSETSDESPTADDASVRLLTETTTVAPPTTTCELKRRRLGDMELKHWLAIDIPEYSVTTSADAEQHLFNANSNSTRQNSYQPKSVADDCQTVSKDEATDNILDAVTDGLFECLDNANFQFFIVFIVLTTVLTVVLRIPTFCLVIFIGVVSLLRLCVCSEPVCQR